jgi:hypothetical protein
MSTLKHTYEVIMPFGRLENLDRMTELLRPHGVIWHPIFDLGIRPKIKEEDWIRISFCSEPQPGWNRPHFISNFWMDVNKTNPGSRYLFINDDDALEPGFLEKIDAVDGEVIVCSMKRGDNQPPSGPQYGTGTLVASKANIRPGYVGGEQLIVGARIMTMIRFGPSAFGDGEMVMRACAAAPASFVPDAFILFNYLEPGRWNKVDVPSKPA